MLAKEATLERAVLAHVNRYGMTDGLPRTGKYSDAIREAWQRGLIVTRPRLTCDLTSAGREALARHEAGDRRG